jgi:hypothetical protein
LAFLDRKAIRNYIAGSAMLDDPHQISVYMADRVCWITEEYSGSEIDV